MKSPGIKLILAPLYLALQQVLMMPHASAQAAAAPESSAKSATTLDQITVTSRQRSERLQDVPIAVTAFNTADIRNAGISRPRDFISLTPNVNIDEAQNAGTSFITIRGIAQVRNSEQPVAVVVDGVPQVSSNQFNQELYDIAQIEVLKGPQGALYGSNSIGGAINITTMAPELERGGYLQAGVGNGGLQRAQASYGGGLDAAGRWRAQLSGFYSDFDGLLENTYLHEKVNNMRSHGVRARMLGELSEDLDLDVIVSDGRDEGGAINYIFQPLYGVNDAGNASLPVTANNHGYNLRKNSQLSVKFNLQREWGSFTSITAWSRVSEYYNGDQFPYSPGTSVNPLPGWAGTDGVQAQYHYVRGLSQELRFTSNSDQRLRWIGGVYAQLVDRYTALNTGLDLGLGIDANPRGPNGPDSRSPTSTFFADDNDNDTYAAFGQLAYDLNPQLEAALALRFDHARREQTNRAPLAFDANAGEVRAATFKALQPKFSLTWKPVQNFSAFASVARGFNSGGFNQGGSGAAATAAGIAGISDQYGKEIADSYELGLKSRPLQWLEFNASAFRTELKNQPYYVFVPQVGAQVIAPIDKAQMRGVELEVKLAPTRDFTVFGSYGYTDSEIRQYASDAAVVGNRSPYVPRYTANLGAQYQLALGESLNATLRADYRRLGEQYWDAANSTSRPSLDLIDARLILQPVSGSWSLALWGRNLTDKQYLSEWVAGGFAHMAAPRTYGADLRWNF